MERGGQGRDGFTPLQKCPHTVCVLGGEGGVERRMGGTHGSGVLRCVCVSVCVRHGDGVELCTARTQGHRLDGRWAERAPRQTLADSGL